MDKILHDTICDASLKIHHKKCARKGANNYTQSFNEKKFKITHTHKYSVRHVTATHENVHPCTVGINMRVFAYV